MASDDEDMEVNRKEEDDDDDDDDDDDSDDTSEEEIDDSKQEEELVALRNIIKSNPYNYQSHIDYITLSRQYANLDHLRCARKTMSEIYPLTEQLWLDWIHDEKLLLLANTEENKDFIQLFERSINDYLSVKIWIEYIQYLLPYFSSSQSIEQVRNLFERALSSCAVHFIDGHLLWTAYIETEQAILDGIILNYKQNNTNNDLKEKIFQHIDFILTLYRRQLSIPSHELKNIYFKNYQEFIQQYKEYLPLNYNEQYDLKLKQDFESTLKQSEQCEKFEQELIQTNKSLITYKKYIQFEKEPSRIQCLYERAIVDNWFDGDLWISYIDFTEEYLPSNSILEKVFERSLRNCPWIATLWIRYAEYMELNKLADHSQLKKIYDRALNSDPTNLISFVDLNSSYIQYRRRHYEEQQQQQNSIELNSLKEDIRHICEYACDQYQELFLSSNDLTLFLKYNGQLELYWIHLEIKLFNSIEHARQIWNGRTLMNKTHNQIISNLWKYYYYMELSYGDNKHARKVLYRALNYIQTMDYPFIICDLLLEHEKKYGNIQQLKETKDKLKEIKRKLIPIDNKKLNTKTNKKQKDTKKKSKEKNSNNQMDTTTSSIETNGKTTEQQSPRKRKLSPDEIQNVKKKPPITTIDSQGFKIPAIPPPPTTTTTSSTTPKNMDHLNTVFIANLAYDVNEDDIRQALSPAGSIKDIRIVKHEWSGKSKGFGYVDFNTNESYHQALKLDHTLINGRPMYVSIYDPNKALSNDITKKFKYATTLEQNKLFLSNLPFAVTKEEIEKLFLEQGFKVKDVRLVTQKSGKPKGLAYAEFNDAHEASQAVLKLNETDMNGHKIKVSISNPPQRKEPSKSTSTTTSFQPRATSLGEAPKPTGARGRGHSQISLIPRNVTSTSTTSQIESTTTTTTNSMNNNDFRNMLLNKK